MVKFNLVISVLIYLLLQASYTFATPPAQSTLLTQGKYDSLRDQISSIIKTKMDKNDITGLSIAVVDGQEVVWADGFGWADKKKKIKATPETGYRVGSITKLFTDTAVMQLAEQGKLDIDQPLQNILPQFSIKSRFGNTDKITPRNIMTHHSGLPANYMQGMWEEEPVAFTRLVDLLKDEYTAYAPETIFCYSNLGVTLLGHAIQEVSGQPYNELIRQKLFIPLGMSDSYIATTLRDDPQSSKGYLDDEEAPAIPLRDVPAGGLNSTVLDLANFTKMVFAGGRFDGKQIIKKETLDQMMQFQDGDAAYDLGNQIGLGWFLEKQNSDDSGLKALHGGDTLLFHSMLITLPRHQLAVIVLANSESSEGIVSEIAEETLKLALESKTGITQPADKKLSDTELPPTSEDLDTFPGDYSTDGGMVQIIRDDDRLKFKSNDDTLNLVLRTDGQYHMQYKLMGLFSIDLEELEELGITHTEIHGKEVLLGSFRGHTFLFGTKIIPSPISAPWKSRTGRYEIVNPSSGALYKDLELAFEDNFLVIRYTIQFPHQQETEDVSQVALRVIDDENAVIHGLVSGSGDTLRVVHHNGEELLSLSGFLCRKVQ